MCKIENKDLSNINSFIFKNLKNILILLLKNNKIEDEKLEEFDILVNKNYDKKYILNLILKKYEALKLKEEILEKNVIFSLLIENVLFTIFEELSKKYEFQYFWLEAIENFVFENVYNVDLNSIENIDSKIIKNNI